MAVVIALVVYLSAVALPRGRPAAVGLLVGFGVAGLAWMTVPAGESDVAVLYRLYLALAAIGLLMAAFAQLLRLLLPREGLLSRLYPAVVLMVAGIAPMAARAVLG